VFPKFERGPPAARSAAGCPAIIGALIEVLIGPLAPPAWQEPAVMRAEAQRPTLFALRALGVSDARALGLVMQTKTEF
jgi:hypothetical protein